VDDPVATIGMIAELCAWMGFILGGLCLFIRLIVQTVDGTWIRTHAAVVGNPPASRVRWAAGDGVIRECDLTESERDQLHGVREPEVYYRQRMPEQMRLHAVTPASSVLRLVGLVLLGVGAVAVVVAVVLFIAGG
jgi:hypothetical protein